jgi:hypothetical protein
LSGYFHFIRIRRLEGKDRGKWVGGCRSEEVVYSIQYSRFEEVGWKEKVGRCGLVEGD